MHRTSSTLKPNHVIGQHFGNNEQEKQRKREEKGSSQQPTKQKLTSNIRCIRRNIRKVQRDLHLRKRLRRDRHRQIPLPHLEIRIQIKNRRVHFTQFKRQEVALGVHFEVEVGCEGEVGRGAREDR